MNWKRRLQRLVGGADDLTDRLRGHIGRIAPLSGPYVVVPYVGYGTPERLLLHGRVLRDKNFAEQSAADPLWRNLVDLYKRLESDEVPGARLRVRLAGEEQPAVADAEGYFSADLVLPQPLPRSGWHEAELELIDPPPPAGSRVCAAAPLLVPPAGARFGVISDIDDTVMWSSVTNKLRMLALLARSNPHTRKPFKGVAAFYRALRDGVGGAEANPVFYVSGSPWNLYEPLVEFMRVQGIPPGPLLLKDFGDHTLFALHDRQQHKLEHIERILQRFAHLPFVLIGDSGERDPEIYSAVVHAHPERIRVIYIRSVDPDPGRIEAIDRLIAQVQASGAHLVLAPDSEFAAVHAAAEGLIAAQAVMDVRADKREDEAAPAPSRDAGTTGSGARRGPPDEA